MALVLGVLSYVSPTNNSLWPHYHPDRLKNKKYNTSTLDDTINAATMKANPLGELRIASEGGGHLGTSVFLGGGPNPPSESYEKDDPPPFVNY